MSVNNSETPSVSTIFHLILLWHSANFLFMIPSEKWCKSSASKIFSASFFQKFQYSLYQIWSRIIFITQLCISLFLLLCWSFYVCSHMQKLDMLCLLYVCRDAVLSVFKAGHNEDYSTNALSGDLDYFIIQLSAHVFNGAFLLFLLIFSETVLCLCGLSYSSNLTVYCNFFLFCILIYIFVNSTLK